MKVYITYDRYEGNEWFNVYHISTRKSESIKHCKEEDLPNFISYGPDDCHSFQLQVVEMTKKEYEQLLKWFEDEHMSLEHPDSPYYQFMCEVFDNVGWKGHEDEILISTDGCSDFYEIIKYYSVFYKGVDVEEISEDDFIYSDKFQEYREELDDDDDLFQKVLKEYIRDNY